MNYWAFVFGSHKLPSSVLWNLYFRLIVPVNALGFLPAYTPSTGKRKWRIRIIVKSTGITYFSLSKKQSIIIQTDAVFRTFIIFWCPVTYFSFTFVNIRLIDVFRERGGGGVLAVFQFWTTPVKSRMTFKWYDMIVVLLKKTRLDWIIPMFLLPRHGFDNPRISPCLVIIAATYFFFTVRIIVARYIIPKGVFYLLSSS